MYTGVTDAFRQSSGTFPSRSDVLKMSESMGAISLWSSFRIREVKLSGPAAFPGFNLESCLDTPLIVILMSGIEGNLRLLGRISSARCLSFKGTSFVKTDWNCPLRILALSEAFVYTIPFDLREVISLLSDFCCLMSFQKRLLGLAGSSEFSV